MLAIRLVRTTTAHAKVCKSTDTRRWRRRATKPFYQGPRNGAVDVEVGAGGAKKVAHAQRGVRWQRRRQSRTQRQSLHWKKIGWSID